MSAPPPEFDRHAATYEADLQGSLPGALAEDRYFAEYKVRHVVRRLGGKRQQRRGERERSGETQEFLHGALDEGSENLFSEGKFRNAKRCGKKSVRKNFRRR